MSEPTYLESLEILHNEKLSEALEVTPRIVNFHYEIILLNSAREWIQEAVNRVIVGLNNIPNDSHMREHADAAMERILSHTGEDWASTSEMLSEKAKRSNFVDFLTGITTKNDDEERLTGVKGHKSIFNASTRKFLEILEYINEHPAKAVQAESTAD